MNQPRLSLCMIVRDEEAMLPDFLASVANLWDEFIAVDTGSQDESVAMLLAAGAKVIPFTWIDDFAAARNASLDQATGEWILFLDADERVSPDLKDAIRALCNDAEAGAATINMRNELPGGHRRDRQLLRLFRNDPSIRFRHRIHEDVSAGVRDFLQRENLRLRHLSQVVDHLGYVREVAAGKDKKERDLKLLRQSLEQDPDDFYCRFKILEIARFWTDDELWRDEAMGCAKLLDNLNEQQAADLKGKIWSGELAAMISKGLDTDSPGALIWLEGTGSWSQASAPWLLRKANLLEETGRLEEAADSFRKCLEVPDEASTQLVTVRPVLGLCRLALGRGKLDEAVDLARQAADAAPVDPEALLALVTCAGALNSSEIITDHLQHHTAATLPLARIFLGGGQVPQARDLLLPRAMHDHEATLGLLVCSLVLGEEFDFEINVSQDTADTLLRDWVHCLWQSRDTKALEAFADNCGSIVGIFPWLPDFLAKETRQLK